jgi:hypothetical protein
MKATYMWQRRICQQPCIRSWGIPLSSDRLTSTWAVRCNVTSLTRKTDLKHPKMLFTLTCGDNPSLGEVLLLITNLQRRTLKGAFQLTLFLSQSAYRTFHYYVPYFAQWFLEKNKKIKKKHSYEYALLEPSLLSYYCSVFNFQGWFVGWFIPVAPTWSIGHPWNASFHFSFLI